MQLKKEKQKEVYNRKARDLPIIPTGATVRIHDGKTRIEKALVTDKSRMPRYYNIKTKSWNFLCRNRQHLLLSKEPSKLTIEVDEDVTLLIASVAIQINLKRRVRLHLSINLLLVHIRAICDRMLDLQKDMVLHDSLYCKTSSSYVQRQTQRQFQDMTLIYVAYDIIFYYIMFVSGFVTRICRYSFLFILLYFQRKRDVMISHVMIM